MCSVNPSQTLSLRCDLRLAFGPFNIYIDCIHLYIKTDIIYESYPYKIFRFRNQRLRPFLIAWLSSGGEQKGQSHKLLIKRLKRTYVGLISIEMFRICNIVLNSQ